MERWTYFIALSQSSRKPRMERSFRSSTSNSSPMSACITQTSVRSDCLSPLFPIVVRSFVFFSLLLPRLALLSLHLLPSFLASAALQSFLSLPTPQTLILRIHQVCVRVAFRSPSVVLSPFCIDLQSTSSMLAGPQLRSVLMRKLLLRRRRGEGRRLLLKSFCMNARGYPETRRRRSHAR
jgi:hypothetical protein